MRIETARLVLRRLEAADLEPLASILLHPEVVGWLGPPGATTQDVERALELYERQWAERGYGRLAVCERTTGTLVGRAGVMYEAAWTATPCKDEIGWVTDRRLWGRGLATEAAAAALADVFDRVGLEQVVSYASPDNSASIRVIEKLGFVRGGKTRWNGSEHVWYWITADRVRAREVSD